MDPIESQLGLDIYFPGCDKYHQKWRPDNLPYEMCGLRRIPPLYRDAQQQAIEKRGRENPSSLEEACVYGCLAQVITLWAQGVEMKGQRAVYRGIDATPLMWAVLHNHLPVVRFLLDQNVNVNEANNLGHTALHWAVTGSSYEATRMLLENGADATLRDRQGFTPHFNAVQGDNLGLLLILCEVSPLDPRERDTEEHSLLHWAAYNNALAICQYLIENCRMEFDARDVNGRTALTWAAREGYAEVVEYFVTQGARTELTDLDGYTPLQYAINRHHREAAFVLQNHPAARRNGVTSSVEGGASTRKKWMPGGYVPVSAKRRFGTLRMMLQQPVFLAMAFFGVFYVLFCFTCTSIVPPVFSHVLLALCFFRNVLWANIFKFPVQGGYIQPTFMQSIGVARNFGESARGFWLFRNRDPALLFAIFTFMFIQQYAWSRLGLSSMLFQSGDVNDVALAGQTRVEKPYGNGEGLIFFTSKAEMERFVVLLLIGIIAISVFLCKLFSMFSVYEMNGNLDSSPIWVIIRKRLYRWLHPRILFIDRHALIPLRAFYCYERDVTLRCYDGYSISLDCPVAESNHLFFFIFVNAFAVLQWLLFFWSWEQTSELLECPKDYSFLWSLIVSPWNLFVHALPCADVLHVSGLSWAPSLSFLKYFIPTYANQYGVWVLQYSLVAACMSTYVALRQWIGVWRGATRVELANPTATGSDGGLVSIFPETPAASVPWVPPPGSLEGLSAPDENSGARGEAAAKVSRPRCVYSGANGFVNVAAFGLGIAGRRWRNAMAISLSNAPVYTTAPMHEGIV